MLNNKKASIPIIKTIVILLISTLILLSFILILLKTSGVKIDDKKLQADIIANKLFNSNCFGKEYGIIEKNLFTQENLDNCYKNLPENMAFCVDINEPGLNPSCVNEEIFNAKKSYCLNSNMYCTEITYPITLKTGNNQESRKLKIQVIIN